MQTSKSWPARLRKFFLILVLVLLVLGLAAANLGEGYARRQLLTQLQDRFGGTASLGAFKLSLLGRVSLDELRAYDANQELVLSIDHFEASVAPLSLLGFYPKVDAALQAFELTLRQLPDGSWNYATWSGEVDGSKPREAEDAKGQEALERLPCFGSLRLVGGSVLLIANSGTTRLEGIRAQASVQADSTRLSLDLDALLQPSASMRALGALEQELSVHANLEGDLKLGPERADWSLDLILGQGPGQLKLKGNTSLAALLGSTQPGEGEESLRLSLEASSVGLSAGLMPLLARLHPVFQSIGSGNSATLGGLLDSSFDLGYRGSIQTSDEPMLWLQSALQAISGNGSLALAGMRLEDAPMVLEMSNYLGLKQRDWKLSPLSFAIQDGRVNYQKGWTWKLGALETSFRGSVGFDGSLDLSWNAPVTDEVIAKHAFLKHLRGQNVGIPVVGTLAKPVFQFQGALQELGSEFVKAQALEKLGLDQVPELEDLQELGLSRLGLGVKQDGALDPAALLKEADRLWDAGQRAEAATIYRTLRAEYKATLTYTLNRSKIKQRADYEG